MFKNATLYRINSPASIVCDSETFETFEGQLSTSQFAPTGLTQEISSGWVPPREKHGALAESVNGQWIIKLMIETRSVPAAAIQEEFERALIQVENDTGRKPGKKESKTIKEDIKLSLLPSAFPKKSAVLGWIDTQAGTLLIDTSSSTKADAFITALIRAVQDFRVTPLQTTTSPAAAMTDWLLSQELDFGFSVDRECVLKATDESKATVKYQNHTLDLEEIAEHLHTGKVPTQLAMTWGHCLSFTLTDALTIKKIAILEVDATEKGDDAFDANVALAAGTLRPALAALINALGGELVAAADHENKSAET